MVGRASCLHHRSDAGEVYAFMDDRQDVYRRWGGATADLTNGPMATFVPIHIDDNLRNTRKIAETFKPFAGDHFTPRAAQACRYGSWTAPPRKRSTSPETAWMR